MNIQKSELHTNDVEKQILKVSIDENDYNKYVASEALLVMLIKYIEKENKE